MLQDLPNACPENFGMSFQDRLSAAITHAKATPKLLAVELGVSVQAVGQVLSGSSRALTAENCARAARYLRVDGFWLATGEGSMTPNGAQSDMALSQQEKDLIVALRVLPEADRHAVIASVMHQAKAQLAQLEALLDRNPANAGTVVPLRR
jgi:transcriptional regulator with XRE-family HTH domain